MFFILVDKSEFLSSNDYAPFVNESTWHNDVELTLQNEYSILNQRKIEYVLSLELLLLH